MELSMRQMRMILKLLLKNLVDSITPGKGFAFVTFSSPEEETVVEEATVAEEATGAEESTVAEEACNGKELCGSTVSVNASKPKVKLEADKNDGGKAAKNNNNKSRKVSDCLSTMSVKTLLRMI
jgi:RNA recognition motif-containing protein